MSKKADDHFYFHPDILFRWNPWLIYSLMYKVWLQYFLENALPAQQKKLIFYIKSAPRLFNIRH